MTNALPVLWKIGLLFSHSPVNNWNQTTLSQVDRFLFFLPENKLQKISLVSLLRGFLFVW